MSIRKPTNHRMTRRANNHDYSAPGIYHITLHVADGLGHPLGQVVGSIDAPDGSADAPHVALTPVGQMVERELLHTISSFYPMLEVQDHVVMPEHLHFIIEAHAPITSRSGKTMPLGLVIDGFKKGCNRHYWELTSQAPQGAEAAAAATAGPAGSGFAGAQTVCPSAVSTQQGKPAGTAAAPSGPHKVPSTGTTGRQPLFSEGYCDVMPLRPGQLATQRAYIHDNPRNRLLRTACPWLSIVRGGIATALKPAALRGYLQRECSPSVCTPDALAAIDSQLLLGADGTITCDSFGDRQLLARPLLPVVCHRRDAARLGEQKARCLAAAQAGTILVSARIAKGEQAIIDEIVNHGFPVILISDNGYAERYHPSSDRLSLCVDRRLLLLTPWRYQYRKADASISVLACKTMNCLAQALCRKKDTWWQA